MYGVLTVSILLGLRGIPHSDAGSSERAAAGQVHHICAQHVCRSDRHLSATDVECSRPTNGHADQQRS